MCDKPEPLYSPDLIGVGLRVDGFISWNITK